MRTATLIGCLLTTTFLPAGEPRATGDEAARWAAGYVRAGDAWVRFDEPTTERASLHRSYRAKRSFARETVDDQLEVANWCRANRLPDRERVHLVNALLLAGEAPMPAIRERLGQRWVAGSWRTEREVDELAAESRQFERAFREWRGRVASIRRGLLAKGASVRAAARERLDEIDDPAAIPALHALLGTAEESARELVRTLDRFGELDATRALAVQAAFSPWESVRRSATRAVATRRPQQYVPLLLSTTRSPYRATYELLAGPSGAIDYLHVVEREGPLTRERDVAEGIRVRHERVVHRRWFDATRPSLPVANEDGRRAALDRRRAFEQLREVRANSAEAANRAARQVNERVAAVLGYVADRAFTGEADELWEWWREFSDVDPVDAKVMTITVNIDLLRREHLRPVTPPPERPAIQQYPLLSCLVAGTPVWTETGPRPIESIRMGDRVLAKDPETGELAYRPVLQTTIRSPQPVVGFPVRGDERIVCTGGHVFWVDGKGWVLARDLVHGDQLHAVTGRVEVESDPMPAGEAEVYNLVVADFHGYFVGRTSPVLSHDVTPERPTDRLVPGR